MKMKNYASPCSNPKAKKLWLVTLAAFLIAAILLATLSWINHKHSRWDRFNDSLISIDPASTADDLQKQGFIDLTDLRSGHDKNLDRFFSQVADGRHAVLKTFSRTSDGLIVRALWHDRWDPFISLYTIEVETQSSLNHGQCFLRIPDEVQTDEGITEVWLRSAGVEPVPNGSDILLYRRQAA